LKGLHRLSPSSPENPINPWESSLGASDSTLPSFVGEHYSVRFSGTLERTAIAKYFGSQLQIGCVVPLVLVSALVWGVILVLGIGVTGLALVTIAAMSVFWFLWIRYVGKNHANRLQKRRPWLVGPIHGIASNGRLTVWHNDVCFQSHLQSFMLNPRRGMLCYPDLENAFPWTMVPSTCFYEDQWYELLEAGRYPRTQEPLIVQAAPPDGWECLLSLDRSLRLGNRTRAIAWRPTFGPLLVLLVLGLWLSFLPGISGIPRIPGGSGLNLTLPVLALLIWVLFEIGRYLLAQFQVMREYSDPNRGAYRKRPIGSRSQLQWFTRQQILFSDSLHWILCPVRYVERVKIRNSWIEFSIGGEPVQFHREGFANESAWQGACKDALEISQGLKQKN
jgi:hypothetical protein